MTLEDINNKVRKANIELFHSGLEHYGFKVQIEISLETYRKLCAGDNFRVIRLEVDTPNERVHRGTIYGTTFVITQDTDRVLIAKEVADN